MKQQKTYYISRSIIDQTYDKVINKWLSQFPMTERQCTERDYLLFNGVLMVIDEYGNDDNQIEYSTFMKKIREVCEAYMWRFSPIKDFAHKFYNSFRARLYPLRYQIESMNGKEK